MHNSKCDLIARVFRNVVEKNDKGALAPNEGTSQLLNEGFEIAKSRLKKDGEIYPI